jgi:hypothetical protein
VEYVGRGELTGSEMRKRHALICRNHPELKHRATKRVERTIRRESKFVFTTKDGAEVPALPEKTGAAPAAASAEDLVILGLDLEPVRV